MAMTAAGATASLADFTWIQLHIGSPGAAGTSNVAAETDRQQVGWAAISVATILSATELDWVGVAASEDYTHWSAHTAGSGGSCGHTGTLTADAVVAGNRFVILAGGLSVVFAGLAS